MSELRTMRGLWRLLVPPWLLDNNAWKLGYGYVVTLDAVLHTTMEAARMRFQGQAGFTLDDLACTLLGRDRMLYRSPLETLTHYAARLPTWLDVHRHRGSARELLRQLHEYGGVDYFAASVIDANGLRHTLLAGPTLQIVRDHVVGWSTGPVEQWARATVLIYTGIFHAFITADFDSLPPSEQAKKLAAQQAALGGLRSLIVDLTPAHVAEIQVAILDPSNEQPFWDELPALPGGVDSTWDAGSASWDAPSGGTAKAPITFAIGASA